ncbi:MAG: Fe-S cluster assembly protein SufD [Pelagibacteraceae bacterium]|jgi:Fe-S cluster assembly protein SufD
MENQIKQNYENFLSKEKFNESQINYKKINLENFFKKGFPNKRQEDWKFSDLNQIIETNIKNLNYISEIDNKDNIEQNPIKDFDHNKIFIVNGQIVKSDLTHEDENKIMISEDQSIEEDDQKNSLLNLNNALVVKNYKIYVSDNYLAKKPLIIYHNVLENIKSSLVSLRLDIDLGKNSSLKVINIFNERSNNNLINIRQKINISENSILEKFILDQNENNNIRYAHTDINLQKNSHLELFILSKGSKFLKNDVICSLNDDHGSIALNGIINLNDTKHHEIKTVINHNEENCKSYQLIKTVLNDQSKSVYQGKIYVNSKAQKTDGYQLSRALLLNQQTEFNAKPELEIYADDVKCSHGSTSGNLDENSIFYLMSRGLSLSQSKELLINGFLQEVAEKISDKQIQQLVKIIMGIQE